MVGLEKRRVVVGAIPTVAPYSLPERLASFSRKYPTVQISVVEEITPVLLERLQEASIDMARLALPGPDDPFVCHALCRDPL